MVYNKVFGKICFKNYRINDVLKIYFCNEIIGQCVVCLSPNNVLTHFAECGHLICTECVKFLKTLNTCVLCRKDNLIFIDYF